MIDPEGRRSVPLVETLPDVTAWQSLQYDARRLGAFRTPLVMLTLWFVASLGVGGALVARRLRRRRGGRRPSAGSSRRG